jgi:hypothetical protein
MRTEDASPVLRSWARRYGFDLADFVPLDIKVGRYTMTVREAVRQFGISEEQVRRHLRSGVIRGIPLGGRNGWRVSRVSARAYAAEREEQGAARRRGDG